MKIRRKSFYRRAGCRPGMPKPGEDGMVTFIFIALLAIMMILVMAESRALFHLHRAAKVLEQQQIKRLDHPPTNVVAVVSPETK